MCHKPASGCGSFCADFGAHNLQLLAIDWMYGSARAAASANKRN
ncbi:hypothetical protein HMPREF9554_01837 [Treponema phagedenis F0421]|nr:hypothetical protein HMPREF9554_01837 [Treponema phagedenis F0421]